MIGLLRDAVRVLGIPCREHTALLSRQLDDRLSKGESLGLWIHLRYCRGCLRFRRQIRLLRELAQALGRDKRLGSNLPEDVSQRVLNRIAQRSEE